MDLSPKIEDEEVEKFGSKISVLSEYTAVSTKVVLEKCKSVRDNADWYYG